MFNPTPIEHYPKLSKFLGIELYVKRDDYFPLAGGGNKARKIINIFSDAVKKGSDAVVSCGAANSNHARVVAIEAARRGWKAVIIIHDIEDYQKGNLLIMKLSGAHIVFVKKDEVKVAMDNAMNKLKKEGRRPYYIWGGGHSIEGSIAYYECFKEIEKQSKGVYDVIIHASGTGTTQTGLHFGAIQAKSNTKVIGISVARNQTRGIEVINESLIEICQHYDEPFSQIGKMNFYDEFSCGGYEKIDEKLLDTLRFSATCEGLILDPTYTGKAFYGLLELVDRKIIQPSSKILFLHTGGEINLFPYSNQLV
ncbi:MAG: pyridoxal-phosphate dependent enzyme [Cyclobacterium sp.]|uniref:1-aminocyclopropane-1-carboxylate deaminase/D-cysteine desulfhydrase n=1 Tax=Cyclobacterium sp. TaxID=1966343 RepID=UPI003970693A